VGLYVDDALLKIPREQLPDARDTGRCLGRPLRCGIAFEFCRAGDELPEHTHPPGEGHITVVAAGAVRISSGGVTRDVAAPAVLVCEEDVPHSFTALLDDTVIVNLSHKVLSSG
jgi:hypothetical protein